MTANSRRRSWGTRWTSRDRLKWAWHNLVPLAAVGLAFWSVLGNERNAADTARESAERRDQICLSAEREHLNSVLRLKRTYFYLQQLTPHDRDMTINQFVLRTLPQVEDEANIDVAPAFCDEPGEAAEKAGEPPIGLPEPDPEIPKRPAALSDLPE